MTHTLYPKEIILEVTNRCNLRCRYCHFHGKHVAPGRLQGDMETSTWKKILRELEVWDRPLTVMTHGAGEPLLYKELFPLLRTAKKNSKLYVGFMTNGMLLDKDWVDRLIDIQVDWIAFSIDGTVKETHDFFRYGADLEKIETNVMSLIEKKHVHGSEVPRLSFNMVGYPEILHQSQDYVKKWLPHATLVTVSKFRPVGSRELWKGEPPFPFRPCPLLYNQMVVSFDGRVGLCCEDINMEADMGSVMTQALEHIFNKSELLLKYRSAHERGEIGDLPLCKDCHVWAGDIPMSEEEIELNGMKAKKITTPAFESYIPIG